MRPFVIAASLALVAWAAVAIYRVAPSVDSDFPPSAYGSKPDMANLRDYIHDRSIA